MCLASKKSSEREFFGPAGTHLGVKLLNETQNNWVLELNHRQSAMCFKRASDLVDITTI